MRYILLAVILAVLSSCVGSSKSLRSPCVGFGTEPCEKRPVNTWF